MSFSNQLETDINQLIEQVVNKYLNKADSKPTANSGNPFVLALLHDFEPLLHRIHGLKTSLGGEMEKMAELIAIEAWGKTQIKRKQNITVELPQNVFATIDTIINNLSNAKTLSNYINEKKLIIDACKKPSKIKEKHTYEFDLIIESRKHIHILEMKGPDPNTTEVPGAKKRLLVALAWGYFQYKTENIDACLCIYYNNKSPLPYRNPKVHYYFDPNGGILVQEHFWNFIGKRKSTFLNLMSLFATYGANNKQRIWDGFSKLIKINNGTNTTANS